MPSGSKHRCMAGHDEFDALLLRYSTSHLNTRVLSLLLETRQNRFLSFFNTSDASERRVTWLLALMQP